jgi:hypothetical protein
MPTSKKKPEDPKDDEASVEEPLPPSDKLDALIHSVYILTERLDKLDSEEKTDADPKDVLIQQSEAAFRSILKGRLPDEELKAMKLDALLTAHKLAKAITPAANGVEVEKDKAEKADSKDKRKQWLIPEILVNSTGDI